MNKDLITVATTWILDNSPNARAAKEPITADTQLLREGYLDSMGFVDLVAFLEQTVDAEIDLLELDEDALFYLRSRGIDEESARGLLVDAFVGEAVDCVGHDAAREAFRQIINGWLADRQTAGGGHGDGS